ncbi:MAG: hypothetical protein U0470_02635 [Anaerolineae bacterium]
MLASPSRAPRATIFPVINDPNVDEYAPFLLATTFGISGRDSYNLLLFNRDDAANGPEIILERIRSNGAGVGPQRVVAGGMGAQLAAAADVLVDDQWLVVWQDDAGGNADIQSTKSASTASRCRRCGRWSPSRPSGGGCGRSRRP